MTHIFMQCLDQVDDQMYFSICALCEVSIDFINDQKYLLYKVSRSVSQHIAQELVA